MSITAIVPTTAPACRATPELAPAGLVEAGDVGQVGLVGGRYRDPELAALDADDEPGDLGPVGRGPCRDRVQRRRLTPRRGAARRRSA
jgi:hypothetical protein